FLKTTLGVTAAAVAAGERAFGQAPAARRSGTLFAAPPVERVRLGLIGLGHQGSSHLQNFLKIPNLEVRALCDLVPAKVEKGVAECVKAGAPKPTTYTGGAEEWRKLCDSDLDLVYVVTPWELHAPMCAEAMLKGKHAATEVPMAPTIDECWKLVDTAEKTKRHCVMMENCCYDREEMMILNMVRQGLFGDLLHAECGYLHDLRDLKLSRTFYEGRWRLAHSIKRNGDLYPTHGLGPVCQWLDVNRGNKLDYLVSMSTKSRGLNLWAAEHFGADSQEARQKYALGDVVNTLLRTNRGETILVTHDTNAPRPYSRRILLQGTKGVVQKYPQPLIHLEGTSKAHEWDDLKQYAEKYEHPVWKTMGDSSKDAGHGGMDYIEDYRLVQCIREGKPTDMDVYDGADWSAVAELSERSIAGNGKPVECPDFTRGAWKSRTPLGIVTV
ncbi:MAG TPA: Gfo/Idh/MocA family oxidoreductase, partial [Gemmatimonadales bacterium]|nr:Gfo/Idh/MocA family oxidoreductase [Gemmatimonadales bacterium]